MPPAKSLRKSAGRLTAEARSQVKPRSNPEKDGAGPRTCLKSAPSGVRPRRLAILISHPIQYFSPLFRRLARQPEIELTVLYCSLQGARPMRDPGFGVSFAWDIPLLEGYRYKALRNLWPGRLQGFFSCLNPGVINELRKGGYDAVMVFGWGSLATWMAFAGAKLAGMPWMIYGDIISLYEGRRRGPRQALRRGLLSALFGATGAFLVSGAFNRKFYELYGIPAERCFHVPFTVDVSFFARRAREARQHRNEIRARLGIPADTVVFLFVGKLLKHKRPWDLLEAMQALGATTPNAAAVFAGEGELRPDLEARIAASGITGAFLLGFRNQRELPEIYATADALVLPSSSDNKPLVTNEAMACGLPVIVSDRTGVWGPGDIVRDGENGFVYPCGDVGALAEAMRKLANDPDLRRRMGRRSGEIISDFGYETCVAGILEALETIVPPEPSPRMPARAWAG
jgi:glycosyltransferase involved in cell wall biosynthesis